MEYLKVDYAVWNFRTCFNLCLVYLSSNEVQERMKTVSTRKESDRIIHVVKDAIGRKFSYGHWKNVKCKHCKKGEVKK